MKYRSIAFFLILLILTMPFTYASFISDIVATSSTGAQDVILPEDTVNFDVYVDVKDPNDIGLGPSDVAEDNVLIVRGSESHSVTECVWHDEEEGVVKCSKSLQISATPGASIYAYDVLLSGTAYRPQPYLYVDTTSPSFSNTQISAFQSGDEINVTVTSTDSSDFSSTVCAGLDYFIAKIGENTLGQADFDGSCSDTASALFPVNFDIEGDVSLCVDVYDAVGKVTSKCADASVDLGKPQITNQQFISPNGNELFGISQNGGFAKVQFNAFDKNGISSASIDVSGDVVPVSCTIISQLPSGKEYLCESQSFEISSGLQSAQISVTDLNGNVGTQVVTANLVVDDDGPVFVSIGKESIADRIYITEQIDLEVTFRDLSLYDADLQLFLGSSSYSAQSCEPDSESNWICTFRLPALIEGEYPIQFTGTDDFGNAYEQVSIPYVIAVDTTDPTFGDAQISGITDIGEIPIVSVPGRVKLGIPIEDESPVSIEADFSTLLRIDGSFDSEYNIVTRDCSSTSCNVTSAPIGANEITEIPITITDAAGNSVTTLVDIFVRSESDSSYPWGVDVELSPEALDREVALSIAQKAFAQVELVDPLGKVEGIIDVRFDQCVTPESIGENQGSREFLQDISFVAQENEFAYLSFQTLQSDIFVDEIIVDCRFRVTSYTGEEVYIDDRITVPVIIPFFNNPVGAPDAALQDKIESAVEDTEGMLATIDEIYSWVKIIETICNVYNTIVGLVAAVQPLLTVIGIQCDSLYGIPIVGPGLSAACQSSSAGFCAGKEAMNLGTDVAMNIFGKFCAFISCQINFCGGGGLGMLTGFGDIGSNVGQFIDSGTTTQTQANYNGTLGRITGAADANGLSIWDPNGLPSQICTLCIPGILRKFHDYRQIQCSYALCLIDQASVGSLSESACDEIKASMECKFWAGELFSLFPFAYLWDQLLDTLAMMLADPIAAMFGIGTIACAAYCYKIGAVPSNNTLDSICSTLHQLKRVINFIKVITSIGDMFNNFLNFDDTQDSCEAMDSAYDSFKSENKAYEERLEARQGVIG